ncbi:ABC transporter ATP-binding protein [Comamonas badia]|uniref:ABC transporter ATP-binding protein n=1 Tax=Comamonas badia TaxID=265291 RepID=UPI0009FBF32C|nr:ABC transporter ATP-binding protein [Comamonas badia]
MYTLVYSLLRHLSTKRRWQLALVLLLMVAGAFAEVSTLGAIVPFLGLLASSEFLDKAPWAANALDVFAAALGSSRLTAASIAFAGLALGAGVLRLLLTWSGNRVIFAIGADLGALVFSRVLRQSYVYHLQRNSSETLSAVNKIGMLTAGSLVSLLNMIVSAVIAASILGALLLVDAKIALVAGAVIGGLYVATSVWAKSKLQINSETIAQGDARRIQSLQEGIGAIRDIILEHNQQVYVSQFEQTDRAVRTAQATNATFAGAPKYVIESIAIILVIALANWLVRGAGGLAEALPVLGALALGGQRLLPHVQTIYNGYASYRGGIATAQETLELLSLPISPAPSAPPADALPAAPLHSIELRNIRFAYDPEQKEVLRGVNLAIHAGERVGFIGVTGGGKSTLLDICMGLLTPTAGAVVVNGESLDAHNMPTWHRRIAHVPQAIFLCDKSIAENVALGLRPADIDPAHLQQALQAAQLGDFITSLPEGVHTRVGERGVQLSGGQRQRIGIARALYKKADVLVLDEATSALDGKTEAKVMDAIYQLNPGIIILMIAHRVSTLARCNRIYRLEGGLAHEAALENIDKKQPTTLAGKSPEAIQS